MPYLFLRLALRSLARQKAFSFINVVGLALGMSVSLLLISFWSFVSSFDDFHSNADRIYRVISTYEEGLEHNLLASAPLALGKRMKEELPQIEELVRICATFQGNIVNHKLDIPFTGLYADASFLTVFDFETINGNLRLALIKPNSIVLTEPTAIKLFGTTDIVGKLVDLEALGQFLVTGVVRAQKRTHLMFDALVSMSSLPAHITGDESNRDQWTSYKDQYVYFLLDHRGNTESISDWLNKVAGEVNSRSLAKVTFHLQALGDITPGPDLDNALGPDSDYTLIAVFATICLLILIPACLNYANLSIAQALKRSREIGIRKTMGGKRIQLFVQFIGEAVTMTLVSLFGAVLIFFLIRPYFEDMMPGAWLDLTLTWEMMVLFLAFALATGSMAGVFPALYFSALNPIQALKGKLKTRGRFRLATQKVLVVMQFSISFSFIVLLVLFSRQYQYNLNYNYGFNTKNVLDVKLAGTAPDIFANEFSGISGVQQISMSSDVLGASSSQVVIHHRDTQDSLQASQMFVDSNYVGNMGLILAAGRNFDDASERENHVIVNEEFLKTWSIATPVDAIGMTFTVDGKDLQVIGVVKNFHFESLLQPIKAFILRTDRSKFEYANVRVMSSDIGASIAEMELSWGKLSDTRFDAHFFDDEIEGLYHFYQALLQMIGYLGLLAMSISILGLLGMVVYTTQNRVKEVGIRKVFGASDSSIVFLLSKEFLLMMLVAVVISLPFCSLLFDGILSSMQHYHVTFGIVDVLAGIGIFLIAGSSTIASNTLSAASRNPVDTLKYE